MSPFGYRFRAMFITQDNALSSPLWERLRVDYDVITPICKSVDGTHQFPDILDAVCGLVPDIVVLDLPSDWQPIFHLIRQIRVLAPHTHVVVIAQRHEQADIVKALQAGAIGYVYHECREATLLDVMNAAMQDRGTLDSAIASEIQTCFRRGQAGEHDLTQRERRILRHSADGWSTAAIARHEDISESIIHSHLGNIIMKLSAYSGDSTEQIHATQSARSSIQETNRAWHDNNPRSSAFSVAYQSELSIWGFPFFALLLNEIGILMAELGEWQNSAFGKHVKWMNRLPLWLM